MTDYDDERADDEEKRARADEDIGSVLDVIRVNRVLHWRERERQIKVAIGAMLNAEVTLQTVYDCAGVPSSLARQARRDAIALTEAIALLKGTES